MIGSSKTKYSEEFNEEDTDVLLKNMMDSLIFIDTDIQNKIVEQLLIYNKDLAEKLRYELNL